jgi:hypothetical protein
MANTFKNYFVKNANTTAQTVMTTGAGVQATIIGMTLANMTTSPITANVYITSGGTDYYVVSQGGIPVGSSLVPVGREQKLVLEATDALKVSASGNTDVIVSVLEIS